mgnify:CR=1 FL=1
MTDFPWDIAIGLGIVLLGTLAIIAWVLLYDYLDDQNANEKRIQQQDHQQEYQGNDEGRSSSEASGCYSNEYGQKENGS